MGLLYTFKYFFQASTRERCEQTAAGIKLNAHQSGQSNQNRNAAGFDLRQPEDGVLLEPIQFKS
jgi:hypothetical protein